MSSRRNLEFTAIFLEAKASQDHMTRVLSDQEIFVLYCNLEKGLKYMLEMSPLN